MIRVAERAYKHIYLLKELPRILDTLSYSVGLESQELFHTHTYLHLDQEINKLSKRFNKQKQKDIIQHMNNTHKSESIGCFNSFEKSKNKKDYLEKEQKIGAIGLRIKKWVTYHGLSFNINPKLKFYKNINACGLKNYESTSTEDLESNLSQENFDKMYLQNFLKELSNV